MIPSTRVGRQRLAAAFAAVGLLALLLASGGYVPGVGADPKPGPCASPEAKKFVVAAALANLGFRGEDLRWEGQFDLNLPGANQRGDGSFSNETVTSADALVAFLKGGNEAQKALRGGVLEGVPSEHHGIVDNPAHWVGVQFLTDVSYTGNTLFRNGAVQQAGTTNRAAGDIWFFLVAEDCTVFTNVGIRAGCANLQLAPPVPAGSTPPPVTGNPTPPPRNPPPPGNPTTTTTPGGGGKDHNDAHPDVLVDTGPEPTRDPAPNTTAPPGTTPAYNPPPGEVPPTTHVPDVPNRPDSGDGATNTTVPPTTVAPPVTRPPAPPATGAPSGPPGSG